MSSQTVYLGKDTVKIQLCSFSLEFGVPVSVSVTVQFSAQIQLNRQLNWNSKPQLPLQDRIQ
jgi:hypothetical protein